MAKEPGAWLTPEMRSAIKDVMEHRHGTIPSDHDINWVSAAEEHNAYIQYQSRIIRRLETLLVRQSQTTDPTHHASELLTEASACYRDGRFYACIVVCRAALEAAVETAVGKAGASRHRATLADMMRLLDPEPSAMADELRLIGNEFVHHNHERILARDEARIDAVEFVGDQPAESDRPALETRIKVSSAAESLAFRAYHLAVRVCEKLIPPRDASSRR